MRGAYAYKSEARFSRRQFWFRLWPGTPPLARREAELTFDFQDNVAALGNTRHRLYDDGDRFLIDLVDRTSSAMAPASP